MLLKSRYVVPVDAPVIENGAVAIRDGRITAVGPARELTDEAVIDYGDAVICPGFVNAHTHLELTHLAGRVSPSADFVTWLRDLTTIVVQEPPTRPQVQEAVQSGISQSLSAGVTTVGDITRQPARSREVLAESILRGVSFGEVIALGTLRDRLSSRLDAAASPEHQTERIRAGISPHAPYTVEPEAMRACARRADDLATPLCIHLAESPDEDTFTRLGEGRFAEFLRRVGIWDDQIPVSGCSPVELAAQTGLLRPGTIVAHANYVSDGDLDLIAGGACSVAYCPRTHRAFGHPPHRFRDMVARGINVCLGTDSLASNPSLSILDELRFLRREHRDLVAEELLALGTLRGAQALGFAAVTGSITLGKSADLAVIPLAPSRPAARWDSILDSAQPPSPVYVSGVRHRMPHID